MIRRIINVLRNMATALLLLVAVVAATEFALRRTRAPAVGTVTPTTCATLQSLLRPSQVTHHELVPTSDATCQLHPACVAGDFRVNSLGCRGDEPGAKRATGAYRILFLGDDTVCNPWINESDTLPARLQQFMQPKTGAELQVINGAVPGDCPLLSWLRFRHTLKELKPDLVILHFDMSDVADDRRYRRQLSLSGSEPVCPHASFAASPSRVASALNTVRHSAIASSLLETSHNLAQNAISDSSRDNSDTSYGWIADDTFSNRIQISHALEPLKRLRDEVELSGGRFLITTAPVRWQIVDAGSTSSLSERFAIRGVTPYQSRLPFEVVESFCEMHKIRFAAFVREFENFKDPARLFSKSQPVLSRSGLALYAQSLSKYLVADPPVRWARHNFKQMN